MFGGAVIKLFIGGGGPVLRLGGGPIGRTPVALPIPGGGARPRGGPMPMPGGGPRRPGGIVIPCPGGGGPRICCIKPGGGPVPIGLFIGGGGPIII